MSGVEAGWGLSKHGICSCEGKSGRAHNMSCIMAGPPGTHTPGTQPTPTCHSPVSHVPSASLGIAFGTGRTGEELEMYDWRLYSPFVSKYQPHTYSSPSHKPQPFTHSFSPPVYFYVCFPPAHRHYLSFLYDWCRLALSQ